ncbi:MAG: Vgb family protein, partial [Vulcanimicrobiaceae bacterium]
MKSRMLVTRSAVLLASFAFAISLAACGGGNSNSVVPHGVRPPVAPSPVATTPVTQTQTVTLGLPQTVTFTGIASGASGSVAFPATSSGQGLATVTLQSTLPTGVPVPQSVNLQSAGRQPESLGASVTPLAYIVVTPSSALTFRATPGLTFTFPTGALQGYAYVAFFDPTNPQLGWNALAGPVSASGTSVTLPSQLDASPPLALSANSAYIFAIVENATVLPTPTPGPGTITEYSIPTAGAAPIGITAGPDGNLWFAEYCGNNIGKITPSGTITEYPVPTAYANPFDITAGPDGNLWFTEGSGNNIGKIIPSGTITEYPVPTAGAGPYDITTGPDGNLWFTEQNGNNIGKITTSGVITEYPVPTANALPYGITAGPDGNLWFTEGSGNNIGKITTSGVVTEYPVPTGS